MLPIHVIVYTVFLGVFLHMLKKFAKMGFKNLCIYIFFGVVIFCTLESCSQQTKPSIISAKCNVKVIAKITL